MKSNILIKIQDPKCVERGSETAKRADPLFPTSIECRHRTVTTLERAGKGHSRLWATAAGSGTALLAAAAVPRHPTATASPTPAPWITSVSVCQRPNGRLHHSPPSPPLPPPPPPPSPGESSRRLRLWRLRAHSASGAAPRRVVQRPSRPSPLHVRPSIITMFTCRMEA